MSTGYLPDDLRRLEQQYIQGNIGNGQYMDGNRSILVGGMERQREVEEQRRLRQEYIMGTGQFLGQSLPGNRVSRAHEIAESQMAQMQAAGMRLLPSLRAPKPGEPGYGDSFGSLSGGGRL